MVRPFVIAMCDNFYRAGAEAAKNLLERQLLDDGK
jgi:hypothetical protein